MWWVALTQTGGSRPVERPRLPGQGRFCFVDALLPGDLALLAAISMDGMD